MTAVRSWGLFLGAPLDDDKQVDICHQLRCQQSFR